MPAASAAALLKKGKDAYGWAEEYELEGAWAKPGVAGTDSRLSFKARHAVRSAWIGIHWGGGFSPALLVANSGQGPQATERAASARYQITEAARANDANVDNGLRLAERYLNLALVEAERTGISVPDIVALRSLPPDQLQLDGTAVALETQLAQVRARMGTQRSISQALEAYERLYNAFTYLSAAGKHEPPTSHKIALANKIAHLYTGLGRRKEAESWYTGALSDVPSPISEQLVAGDVSSSIQSSQVLTSTSLAITRGVVSSLLGLSVLYATPPETAQRQGGSLQIDPEYKAHLEQALGTQIAALRILRLELQRLSSPLPGAKEVDDKRRVEPNPSIAASALPSGSEEAVSNALSTGPSKWSFQSTPSSEPDSLGKELYWLWLLQKDGQSGMLLAETIYALQLEKRSREEALLGASSSAGASALLFALKSAFGGTSISAKSAAAGAKKHAQSIAWLQESEAAAERVFSALVAAPKGSKKSKRQIAAHELQVAEQWKANPAFEAVAARLLGDSARMEASAGEMIAVLERQGS